MSLYIGAIIILGIALALFLIFRKIFTKKGDTVSQDMASDEVLKKEVSHFDPATGEEKEEGESEEKGEKKEKPIEKSDDNKEIR